MLVHLFRRKTGPNDIGFIAATSPNMQKSQQYGTFELNSTKPIWCAIYDVENRLENLKCETVSYFSGL
jgi:hypothetical protein